MHLNLNQFTTIFNDFIIIKLNSDFLIRIANTIKPIKQLLYFINKFMETIDIEEKDNNNDEKCPRHFWRTYVDNALNEKYRECKKCGKLQRKEKCWRDIKNW